MARNIIFDGIGPVLAYMIVSVPVKAAASMAEGKLELENHARQNAPWADRTGAARNGLYANVYEELGEIVLELGHSVDYGIWLELIQEGRFAVIMPTLEELGPGIIERAGGAVMDVG